MSTPSGSPSETVVQIPNEPDMNTTPSFTIRKRDFGFLPIPPAQRYDPNRPFKFTLFLNVLFGCASTFTVANLYYCQPLLIRMAETFGVSYSRVANIPTLTQAGYATGILLITPLGDLVRRRPLLLLIMSLSATACLSLALIPSVIGFEVVSFLIGVLTVTPQIMIPFAADLAPPERRASAISIVFSGLLLGILIARVMSGIVAEFTAWEDVYYVGAGAQYFFVFILYFVLPDWPRNQPKNSKGEPIGYLGILWTMAKFAVTEPLLIQGCLIGLVSSAVFASFWTTLTFLLGGPLYNYSTVEIGLFGLVGMLGVFTAPIVGRLIDNVVPWLAQLIAILMMLAFQAILTGAAGINIGAVIVACFGIDVGQQMEQVSIVTRIYAIDPSAKARLNSIFIICIFVGQVMGTSVGTRVFVNHGWRAGAGLSLGWIGVMLLLLLVRGPHAKRFTWFGWEGGAEMRKSRVEAAASAKTDEETGQQSDEKDHAGERGDIKVIPEEEESPVERKEKESLE